MTPDQTFAAPVVDYNRVANAIQALKPRALTTPQFDDVFVMMEWMQEQLVAMHNAAAERGGLLDAREAEVSRREKEVAVRTRALDVGQQISAARKLAGYLRR